MGQQEVYDLLKTYKNKWLSSKEIAKRLKASASSVICSLKKLREGGIVGFKLAKRIALQEYICCGLPKNSKIRLYTYICYINQNYYLFSSKNSSNLLSFFSNTFNLSQNIILIPFSPST